MSSGNEPGNLDEDIFRLITRFEQADGEDLTSITVLLIKVGPPAILPLLKARYEAHLNKKLVLVRRIEQVLFKLKLAQFFSNLPGDIVWDNALVDTCLDYVIVHTEMESENIGNNNPDVLKAALQGLTVIGPPLLDHLQGVLTGQYEFRDEIYEAVIETLLSQKDTVLNLMIPRLKKGNKWERQDAATILGYLGDERAIEPLKLALTNKNEDVGYEAAIALGRLRALEPLLENLQQAKGRTLWGIIFALGELRDNRALKSLLEVLKTAPAETQKDIAHALNKIGDKEAIEAVTSLLESNSSDIRLIAVRTLGEMNANQSLGNLVELLQWEDDFRVRGSVALVLGQIGNEVILPVLQELLEDKYYTVRQSASTAINILKSGKKVASGIYQVPDDDY